MCGDGQIEELLHAPKSPALRAAYVKFVGGAHTKWHFHSGEQILVAMEGQGFVEFQGLSPQGMNERDRVIIPAGTWHRHGADEGGTFIHLAVTIGDTEWDNHDPCQR